MNSLASILYSPSSAQTVKRKNLSLQTTTKPFLTTTDSKLKIRRKLFRSSTPKTPLTNRGTAAHPITISSCLSKNSPQTPRCSTPLFSKQRRTRPFIVCELCRQRALEFFNENKNEKKCFSENRSTTLFHSAKQLNKKSDRRRSSIDQLLVWIV